MGAVSILLAVAFTGGSGGKRGMNSKSRNLKFGFRFKLEIRKKEKKLFCFFTYVFRASQAEHWDSLN